METLAGSEKVLILSTPIPSSLTLLTTSIFDFPLGRNLPRNSGNDSNSVTTATENQVIKRVGNYCQPPLLIKS